MRSISFEDIAEKFNDGVRKTSDNKGLASEVFNTIFEMPLKNSLVMIKGPNAGEYTRDGTASIIDRYGMVRYVSPNEPRFNEKGMLFEGERTNFITYSNDFSQWAGGQKTANFGISPDGTKNSTRVTFSGNNQSIAMHNVSTIGLKYSGQIWIKGIKNQTILYQFGGGDITHTLSGGWDLVKHENFNVTRTDFNVSTYGGVTARDIELFGAQCEENVFCTSYIPTNGTIETVSMDKLIIHSTNILQYNTPKTIAIDYIPLSETFNTNRELLSFNDSAFFRCNTDGDYQVFAGGNNILLDANTGNDRIIMVYDEGIIKGYLNSEFLNERVIASSTEPVTKIVIGSDTNNSAWGYLANIRMYDKKLNDIALLVL